MKKHLLLFAIALFFIKNLAAQTGNTCATARVVTAIPYSDSYSTCGRVNDFSSASACDYPDNFDEDVIYRFTPTTTQVYSLSVSGYTGGGPSIAVNSVSCAFSSACSGTYTTFLPAATTDAFAFGSMTMNAGTTYYIKIDGYSFSCSPFTFSIDVKPPVYGSSCQFARKIFQKTTCGANAFPSNDLSNVLNTVSGSTGGLSPNCILTESFIDASTFSNCPTDLPCTAEDDRTQKATWVMFTATSAITTINNNATGGNKDLDYGIFSGPCTALVLENCYRVARGASQAFPTIIGQQYFIMINAGAANTLPNQHWLCLTSTIPVPANLQDLCSNAQAVTDGVVYSWNNSIATRDGYNTLCGAAAISNNNVWYKWTTPASWTIGAKAFILVTNQDCNYSQGIQVDVYQSNVNCGNITAGGTANCIAFTAPGNNYNFFASFIPVIGSTYYINIDGACGASCSFDLRINNSLAVPITLLSLNARNMDDYTEVSWNTATEINNSHFIIDRSTNGIDFEMIDKVYSKGNGNTVKNYTYQDKTAAAGIVYYRLKQVDFDGQYTYSNIVSVKKLIKAVQLSRVRPNPTNSFLNYTIDLPENTTGTNIVVEISDVLGNVIYSENKQLVQSSNELDMDVSFLSNGIYFLKVNNAGFNANVKFIKN